MRTELVSIPTDTAPLDGALHRPASGSTRGAVLLLHGNTMNFYVGPPRFLPPRLTELGFTCLAFNRRGHDILTTRDSREPEGGAFQTAAQGVADNEYAAAYLAERGFESPVVVGHSNGGTLGARFAADHPTTRALVLLSAHRGGPEILRRTCDLGHLAGDDLDATLSRARELVATGANDQLLLVPGWWYAISAESLVDREENTPDLLACAERVTCPSLFVVGDSEPASVFPAAEFAAVTQAPSDVEVVADCGHFYRGREAAVVDAVAAWLEELTSAG